MTGRLRLLAWGAFGATMAGLAGNLLLAIFGRSLPAQSNDWPTFLTVVLMIVSFALVGLLIGVRFPRNAIGWICGGLAFVLSIPAGAYGAYAFKLPPPGIGAAYAAMVDNLVFPAFLVLLVFLVILFPDGRLPSRRWRPAAWALGISCTLWVAAFAFAPDTLPNSFTWLHSPLTLPGPAGSFFLVARVFGWLAIAIGLLVAAVALVLRLVRSRGEARQQLKRLAAVGAFFALAWLVTTVASALGLNELSNAIGNVTAPALLAFPIAIGLAIFRYGLYEIDVVINRALVYGALAAFITAVYVGIVVGIGNLIGSQGQPNLLLSIIATAVVAVAFQPVRERVQRLANRFVYGKRATPYEVMADFSERMSETLAPEDVLPRMAEAAARGVAADAARVSVQFPDGSQRAVWWPQEHLDASLQHRVPVNYHDRLVGEIAVAKSPGGATTAGEAKLLDDLAAQAGLILHNLTLTAELQARLAELAVQADTIRASRQRLVTAATAERQRLEQTIRQGAEQELASLAEKLAAVSPVLDADPQQAGAALEGLTGEIQVTLDALRILAHGIYPPLLRDQGLVSALRAQTARAQVPVEMVVDSVGRYPAEIEAAVYFACVEPLRHAAGSSRLTLTGGNGSLRFAIQTPGSGADSVQAIEDRVEAVGGTLERSASGIAGSIPVGVGV